MVPNLGLAQWARERVRPTLMSRDNDRSFSLELWREACQNGLFSPFQDTGLSWSMAMSAFCSNLYGMALGGVDVPFTFTAVAQALAISTVDRFGTPAQRHTYLTPLTSGTSIAGICNAEPCAGTDIRGLTAYATAAGDSAHLTASKGPATNIPHADLLLVSAWTTVPGATGDRRLELYLVDDKERRFQRSDMAHAGMWTGANGAVNIQDERLSRSSHCLGFHNGTAAQGTKVFKECFNLERLLVSVVVMGALEGLLELGISHINERHTFGSPIKSYQYVQEKLVKMYTTAETLHAVIDRTLATDGEAATQPLELDGKRLALLKLLASETAYEAAISYLELYGAAGLSAASVAQKTVRDLLCLKALGGTKELQKNVIFGELDKSPRPAAASAPKAAAKIAA